MMCMIDICNEDCNITCIVCNKTLSYNGGVFSKHIKNKHSINTKEYFKLYYGDSETGLCKCGCKKETSWNPRKGYYHDFLTGHNYKGKNKQNDESVAKRTKKMTENENWKNSIFKKGTIPWNKGITIEDPKVFSMIEKMKRTVNNRSREDNDSINSKISKTAKNNFRLGKRKSGFSLLSKEQKSIARRKAIKTMSEKGTFPNSKKFKTGKYKSLKTNNEVTFASSYELERMKQYDEDDEIITWCRCKDVIEYFCNTDKKIKCYNPDFYVVTKNEVRIEEIKGIITQKTIDKSKYAKKHYDTINQKFVLLFKKKNSLVLEEIKIEDLEHYMRKDTWLKTF